MGSISPEKVMRAFEVLNQQFTGMEGVICAAFFGFSPVESKDSTPDLDVLIVTGGNPDKERIAVALQNLARESEIPVDAWVLTESDLQERMQRFTSKRKQLIPIKVVDEWNGIAYVSTLGHEILVGIIDYANDHPVDEPPIAKSPESVFKYEP